MSGQVSSLTLGRFAVPDRFICSLSPTLTLLEIAAMK